MQKWVKILVCAVLSFSFMFTCIGYAAVTDELFVVGSANVAIPSGLFIVDIQTRSQSSVDVNKVSYIPYSTTVDSTISKSGNRTTGSVTYQITVLNNTGYEYAWRGLYYQSNLTGYNNNYISTSNGNSKLGVVVSFPNGRVVAPNEELVFNVTYTEGRNISSSLSLKTLINYQFGINVESQEAAVDAVHSKFLEILNTESTYNTLLEALDDKFDGYQEWTSNYIGNVSNAVDADSMTVETLFAGQLNMVINGQTTPASVLIKHENLDGNAKTGDDYVAVNNSNGGVFRGYGCEMTLYLTTDSLTTAYGNAPVYVTVFTCDRDDNGNIISDWYKVGDTYLGTAPIVGYNGESGGTGSFITDNWVASNSTYYPTDAYSYTLSSGMTLKDNGNNTGIMNTVDPKAIEVFQDLLIHAKEMIEDTTYAGTGIVVVEDAYAKAAEFYTLDADNNPIANPDSKRVWLCPIISELEHSLKVAQDAIDKIEGNQ